jgi:hypothetical protein
MLLLRRMFMAIRVVVCVFLLFAPVLQAQDDSLERPASGFRSSGMGLTETLLNFAHQQNVRVAVEYVDRSSLDEPIAVSIQNKTVRQGLNAILRNGRGYSYRMLRVPKILAFLIPEILSDLVLTGRSSLLPPLLGKRGGRREEDAGNAETPRNRNLA